MRGTRLFWLFCFVPRGLNNQWRIQRRSQIAKLVVVSVRSNLPQKSSTVLSEPKFGLHQSIFPGLIRRWQLIICRLNYKVTILSPKSNITWQKGKQAFHANTRFGLAICHNNVREPARVLKLGCCESRFDFQTPNVSQTALSFRPPSHEIYLKAELLNVTLKSKNLPSSWEALLLQARHPKTKITPTKCFTAIVFFFSSLQLSCDSDQISDLSLLYLVLVLLVNF